MGRERAFTAKVVMLRGKPTGQVGPSELLDPAIGNCFAAEFGCEVTTRMDQERTIYGASCCWFSGDWAHVSNFVAIFICGWSAGFFNQGVHLPDDQFWANSVIIEGARE